MIDESIKRDVELMRKYKDGRDLDPEDSDEVRSLALIGFFHIGVSLKRKKITAKTLPVGLRLLSNFN